MMGGCCTRCMLHSVHAVLCVCLYLVYAVLSVCCTRCQLMITAWRDREGRLNFVFCDDGWVVDEKYRERGWRWEWSRGYEQIWEIRGTICLIGLGRTRTWYITRQIRTRTCLIGDGKLTSRRICPKSQFLMIFFPVSSHLSLSCPQLYHHLRTQS